MRWFTVRYWSRTANFKRAVIILCVLCVLLLFLKFKSIHEIDLTSRLSSIQGEPVPPEPVVDLVKAEAEAVKNKSNVSAVSDHDAAPSNKTISTESSPSPKHSLPVLDPVNKVRIQAVREAMLHSWKAYRQYAWGKDELTPLSKSSKLWMGAAVTMIDALDTLCLMGLKEQFDEARAWIATPGNLEFNVDKDHTNVFETTIRVLGGFLAAYHCYKDPVLLTKAIDLGSRLVVAFDTPSGIPYSDVNLARKTAQTPAWTSESSLSEVTTLQLEFNELSRLSNDSSYSEKAMKALNSVLKAAGNRGLLPMYVEPITGNLKDERVITMGARTDSYYEYLLKVWVQTGKRDDALEEKYLLAINTMKRRLLMRTQPLGLLFVGELIGGNFSPKMDHLVCFLAGTLVYGVVHGMPKDHLVIAKELGKTCYAMYEQQPSGLSPEIAYFNQERVAPHKRNITKDVTVHEADGFNLLRPETVEALFYLYRVTKDPQYREWGWNIFQAFERHARVDSGGYAALDGVHNLALLRKRDQCDSFWYAETLKYFYLLFHEPATPSAGVLLPLDKWVINTEAHAFPIHSSLGPAASAPPVRSGESLQR